jgi:hypothetical protein
MFDRLTSTFGAKLAPAGEFMSMCLATDRRSRTEIAEMWRAKCISMEWRSEQARERRHSTVRTVVVLCAFCAAGAVCADESPAPVPPAPRAESRSAVAAIDRRVTVLAKALDLDTRQRAELWKILEDQRIAVKRIWSDPATSAAERVPATRALEDRTANQIRSILTGEQKKHYNPPKPQGVEPPSPDVEAWMQKQAQARQPP